MVTKKNDKRTNNDLQNITHKTKDRVTQTLLKAGGELMRSGRVSSSCSASGTRVAQSLFFCVMSCRSFLIYLFFFIVFPESSWS